LRFSILFLLTALLNAPPTQAGQTVSFKSGNHEFEFEHDGRSRYYVVHLPKEYNPQKKSALVIMLHGGGGHARNAMKTTGFNKKSDEEGFIVVYPMGTGFFKKRALTWNAANCCGRAKKQEVDDVGFIIRMLSKLQRDYQIDSKRIFVTGISNGGMLTYKLACQMSEKIAAIAPVAAAFNDETCEPSEPVALVVFHGLLDRQVPFDGGTGREAKEKREDRPVIETVNFWIEQNGCEPIADTEYLFGNKIQRENFSNCQQDTEVLLYTLKIQGHAWPGGKRGYLFGDNPSRLISATDIIWDFFNNHPKK